MSEKREVGELSWFVNWITGWMIGDLDCLQLLYVQARCGAHAVSFRLVAGHKGGPGSSVGIATRYRLDVPGIESRWGARFSAPVRIGPGAHPTSCTMGTGSFPGLKRLGHGVDHLPPSSAEVKERVELYLYTHSGSLWPVLGWILSLPCLWQGIKWPEGKAYHASAPPLLPSWRAQGQIYLSYFNSGKFEVVVAVTANMTCQGCDMSPLRYSSTS